MQVSRLEIFGFKSFMERLILPLKGGVTGVVGPNGCGKSNIVDALRWVLGETNARSLRGGLLEDVIFNGTDKLRPLGLAEVSLTISSESDSLYNDIVASSKEGELEAQLEEADAQIQEVASKLKKLQEDAEKPAPSAELESELEEVVTTEDEETVVVHQHVAADPEKEEGENSVPLRSSPPKLRVIEGGESFEESHEEEIDDEQEQAHNPLVSEQVLNQKFGWLKGVSEVQVTRRLYRSGEAEFFLNRTPCRLRDLKEFFRVVGISARTFTIVAQG
ncbi:MAG: AAA family ATPase, partial [Bdellovibrionales bacterium]|nr:AAA family ATPase [Bdellovibrionales bacterium]